MMDGQRVVVLGGGVIGVATAWYLARNGCEVTLIERRKAAALETSFANAGLITPGMSDPWNAPGTPTLILKWLGRENSPFLLRLGALPGLLSWGIKFLRQCNDTAWRRNTRTILRLCTYSHECLRLLVAETGIDYESNPRGTLRLIRDQPSMEKSVRTADMLRDLGVRSHTLDAAGVIELEPALRGQVDSIVGGIHYPDDEAGDAHLFSQRLAGFANRVGWRFSMVRGSKALRWKVGRSPVSGRAPAASALIPVLWPWGTKAPPGCGPSASGFPSTRSRDTRSPFRSVTGMVLPLFPCRMTASTWAWCESATACG